MVGIAKNALPPAHMTTLPVRTHRSDQASMWGSSKDLRSPHLITWQATQPVQQTSRMSSAAKPLREIPEPNGAKESPCRISKLDRKTVVPICSAFGNYWKSSSDSQKSLQCPAEPETWQGQRSYTAHMTRPQTRQAPTKQSPMGTCKIPINPIKAWSQIT